MRIEITDCGPKAADFTILNSGSVFLFIPLSDGANAWLDEHCSPDGEHTYFGPNLVVEPRYIGDLVNYAIADGLLPVSRH
jgi:hypothetical protein